MRRILILAAVLTLIAGGASAQSVMTPLQPLRAVPDPVGVPVAETAPIEGMAEAVRDWMDLSAREFDPILREHAAPCFVIAMGRMPPDIQDRVISARSFQAGLDGLARTEPDVLNDFDRNTLPCRGAMQIGTEVIPYVAETMPAATQEERDNVVGCMIDVIVFLPVNAMQRIYGATDYPTGIRQTMAAMPELADLDVRLNACYPPGFTPPPTVRPIVPRP
jgi:hypothetical protein